MSCTTLSSTPASGARMCSLRTGKVRALRSGSARRVLAGPLMIGKSPSAAAPQRRVTAEAECQQAAPTATRGRPWAASGTLLGFLAAQAIGGPIGAADAIDKVAEFSASGLIFKDSVEVLAVDDTEVTGVSVYISDFRRSITDKLAKDFFSEPSQASIYCVQTAPEITIKDIDSIKGLEGKEMFAQQKNLNLFQNKTLRVRRIYDEARQTLVYVAYSTRLTKTSDTDSVSAGRYKSSVCAVPLATTSVRSSPAAGDQ